MARNSRTERVTSRPKHLGRMRNTEYAERRGSMNGSYICYGWMTAGSQGKCLSYKLLGKGRGGTTGILKKWRMPLREEVFCMDITTDRESDQSLKTP